MEHKPTFIARAWDRIRELLEVLKYSRFSLLVVVAGGLGLAITGQGREIALRVTDNWLHATAFFFAIIVWAAQSWFWARRVLNSVYPDVRGKRGWQPWLVNHVPRILGALAFALAVAALIAAWFKQRNDAPLAVFTCFVAAAGVAFYYFMVKRYTLMRPLLKKSQSTDPDADLDLLYVWFKWFSIGYGLFFTLFAFIAPAVLGLSIGSAAVLFLGLSSIVPVGGWLVYQTRRQGFPVVTVLIILAFGFSLFNDNHELRRSDSRPRQLGLDEALERWAEQAPVIERRKTIGSDEIIERIKPLTVVATAGGGLRAAQWTATVLGRLTDAAPEFRRSLFAVSGVSGGSVGAAFYDAVLLEDNRECRPPGGSANNDTCYSAQLQKALSHDFLGPALAGLLYPDLMQRFFPIPVNALPDRAEALEDGWRIGWKDVYRKPRTAGLATPFTQLWQQTFDNQGPWLPILLLNGTHQESGKRIVASSLSLDPFVFNDVIDLYDVINTDIPAGTAAVNSARFPYVSPPGTLPCKKGSDQSAVSRTFEAIFGDFFCNNGHVLDGGYFENFGAVTALELVRAALADSYRPDQGSFKIRPVIILISSDPDIVVRRKWPPEKGEPLLCDQDGGTTDRVCLDARFGILKGNHGGNETFGPLQGILNTRGARGILAAKALRRWVEDCGHNPSICGGNDADGPAFAHFRMQVEEGKPSPALGWLLSVESEQNISDMLEVVDHNQRAMDLVLSALGAAKKID